MATILIVEDLAADRKLLTATLRTRGHEVVEATEPEEALATLEQIAPDVVISDIVMPTFSGHEFVRRMREIPAVSAIPVIFYTALYHEQEARSLAHQCGVFDILTKPSPSQVILATVDAALRSTDARTAGRQDDSIAARARGGPGRSSLAGIDRFEAEKERMKAVLEIAEQIVAQRDASALLQRVCAGARRLTLADQAIVGLVTETGAGEMAHTSGFDDATSSRMTLPPADGPLLTAVVRERRPVRARDPRGRPEALGLPADHPAVSSLLSVPIASSSHVYGWLDLRNKLGTDEFTEEDERAAVSLGAHAGIGYENARLFDHLHQRVSGLERELELRSVRIREEERAHLSRTLHDQTMQVLGSLKMDLYWLAARLQLMTGPSWKDATEKLDGILQRLDGTIASVRTLAGELRPALLDRLGLLAAIEGQVAVFRRQSGIRCRVNARIDRIDVDANDAVWVVKIVQEALANVLHHAEATRVTITVSKAAESLTVTIVDNGRGISERDLASEGSFGLIGMRERSALLGGHLAVRRRKPRGTVVKLTMPLPSAQRPSDSRR